MEGGRLFGRQAYVGLARADVGTLTFGRQYDSLVEYLAPLTANRNWGGFLFEHPYDNDNTDNSFRLNNAVQFNSANFGEFRVGATYAFSNNPWQISTNNAQSVGASYTVGGLTLGTAYLNVTNPGANALGAVTTGRVKGPDPRLAWPTRDAPARAPVSLAGPGLDVENDTRDRVVVGGRRKELDLGERYETESDYQERCRRCDAVDVFHDYLLLMV